MALQCPSQGADKWEVVAAPCARARARRILDHLALIEALSSGVVLFHDTNFMQQKSHICCVTAFIFAHYFCSMEISTPFCCFDLTEASVVFKTDHVSCSSSNRILNAEGSTPHKYDTLCTNVAYNFGCILTRSGHAHDQLRRSAAGAWELEKPPKPGAPGLWCRQRPPVRLSAFPSQSYVIASVCVTSVRSAKRRGGNYVLLGCDFDSVPQNASPPSHQLSSSDIYCLSRKSVRSRKGHCGNDVRFDCGADSVAQPAHPPPSSVTSTICVTRCVLCSPRYASRACESRGDLEKALGVGGSLLSCHLGTLALLPSTARVGVLRAPPFGCGVESICQSALPPHFYSQGYDRTSNLMTHQHLYSRYLTTATLAVRSLTCLCGPVYLIAESSDCRKDRDPCSEP